MHRAKHKTDRLPKEIDQIILDRTSKKRYLRGRFLGKGGFAKCYELTDMETKEVYAGKIVSKSMLLKPHQKEKMSMEIAIHRTLNHKSVVGFRGFFEDDDYIYILLELCRRRSLMELHKRRKALTEPEVRYYIKGTVEACQYLHHNNIIHRDLKLGNLFINDEMEIKVGDFGLATRLDFDGERKKTLCGTPNYIAPEVLNKNGHSFEVDVWSLGCILYTLLVGRPPFETCSLKDTYMRIKRNEYCIPAKVSHTAQLLIIKLLRPDPATRPTIDQILKDDFFKGFVPHRLPVSSLTMTPRFATVSSAVETTHAAETAQYTTGTSRKPLLELNSGTTHKPRLKPEVKNGKIVAATKKKSLGVRVIDGESVMIQPGEAIAEEDKEEEEIPKDCFLSDLHEQIVCCIRSKPCEKQNGEDNAEDPASTPIYWVSKWVDYSDKYGLGYQLCDNSVGVLFNDATRLLLNGDGDTLQYIEKDGTEVFYTMKGYPDNLYKKVTLLNFFLSYMNDHLLKTGSKKKEEDASSRLPFLREWFRTTHGIVMHLSNGILQINFFRDHTKIILCPRISAVTYIDEKKNFRTFPLKNIEKYGCCSQIVTRLNYAKGMIQRMMQESAK